MVKRSILVAGLSVFLVVGVVKAGIEVRDNNNNNNLQDCNMDSKIRDLSAELGRRGISNDSGVYHQQMKEALGECYEFYFGEVQGSTDEPTPTPEATVEPTTQPTTQPQNSPSPTQTPASIEIETTSSAPYRDCNNFNCLKNCLQEHNNSSVNGEQINQACL